MSAADESIEENRRLQALRDLLVLDSAPEPVFDSIARMASELCGTPVALISLVDENRQWFKANVGLHDVSETPRSSAFCAHTIRGSRLLEVPDALLDPRFSNNPLVTGDPKIRFYAGAPVVVSGERIGSLCVIDTQPRQIDESQRRQLSRLADVASEALAMRRELIDKTLAVRSLNDRAVRASESHYRAIVEGQSELVSVASPDGRLTYVNLAYGRHFGLLPAQMQGMNLFDFIPEADRDGVRARFGEVLASGGRVSSENRMTAADGNTLWVSWTNAATYDDDGQPVIHSVGRDVTRRKAIEEALRASQAFLNRTGRVAGVGGWSLDLATSELTWSDETRRIHDAPADYVPSVEAAVAFYSPEARPVIAAAVQQGVARGTPWDLELPLVTARGRTVWVRAVGEAEYEDGVPVRLFGAVQDITERKRLEQDLAQQTATLRLVAEAITARVAVVDRTGRYRFVNGAFERDHGEPRDKILGRTVLQVLGEAEVDRRRPWVDRALAGERVAFEIEERGRDGPTMYRHVSYTPLQPDGGPVEGFVVISQDVTSQRIEALRLQELSERDPLTGLLNRAGFERFLNQVLAADGAGSLGMLYIDLDHFKPVNDQHGHAVGDQVLAMFGKRLRQLVRPSDAVARIGGDEFAIVLAGADRPAVAEGVADKVLAIARAPFKVGSLMVQISASVGVAFGLGPHEGWRQLVERADGRLLSAKAAGKSCRISGT